MNKLIVAILIIQVFLAGMAIATWKRLDKIEEDVWKESMRSTLEELIRSERPNAADPARSGKESDEEWEYQDIF